jgi:hypothetical protein
VQILRQPVDILLGSPLLISLDERGTRHHDSGLRGASRREWTPLVSGSGLGAARALVSDLEAK